MATPTVGAGADAVGELGVAFTRTATETASPAISSRGWTIVSGSLGIGATIGTAAALSWVPGASLSGSNDIRQPRFQETAFEFTSTAENSTLDWSGGGVYRYIEDIDDDRGYTGGLVGFTTGTFDLEALVQHYSDIAPGNILEQYLPDLADISSKPENQRTARAHTLLDPPNGNFVVDWQDAADNDPLFARAQRDMRETMYWAPSLAQAIADGVGPLGLLILWDIYVNHGEGDDEESFGGIVATAQGNANPPSDGGNETNYLNALVDARADILAGWDPEEDLSIGRVGALRQLIDAGKLTLAVPLAWDMYTEPFEITATPFPPADSIAGTYVLRYSATNADGTGNDTMTLAVGEDIVEPTPVDPQRLYLSATIFSDPPAGYLADWDNPGGPVSATVALTTAPSGEAAYLTYAETSTSSPFDAVISQWASGPALSDGVLVADQDWPITMARSESAADANLVQAVAAWVRAVDGNYRTTVFSYFFGTEWPVGAGPLDSVAALFTVPGAQIPDDVAIAAGEQLVIEVGYRATNTTASARSGTIILGGTDTPDLANGDSGDALFRPSWVDVPTSEGLLFGDDTGEPPEDGDTAAGNFGWGTPLPESDDFRTYGPEDDVPDPTKWALYDGAGHDGNGTRDPERISVQDGYMRITGLPGGSSGGMAHVLNQTHGRWEVRARVLPDVPGSSGNPYHAVLIVWSDDEDWPAAGEYDFFEVDVEDDHATAFLHYPYPDEASPVQQEQATSDPIDITDWHHYGFEWTADGITGYLDGVEWFHYADGAGAEGRSDIQDMPSGHLTVQLDNFFGTGLQQGYIDVEWANVYTLTPSEPDPETQTITLTAIAGPAVPPSPTITQPEVGGDPIEFRSVAIGGNSTGSTATVTKPAGTVAGDLLIAICTCDVDGTAAALTAPVGGGWTPAGGNGSSTGSPPMRVFYKVAGGSEPSSYAFGTPNTSTSDAVVVVSAWQNVDTTGPIQVVPSFAYSTTGTIATAPAVTATGDGALITAYASSNTGSFSQPTDMHEIADTAPNGWTILAVDYQVISAAGTTGTKASTHTVAGGASAEWTAVALMLEGVGIPAQTINPATIAAPTAIGTPTLDQTPTIRPGTIDAPAVPSSPTLVPGPVDIFTTTVAAPAAPTGPKLVHIIQPTTIPAPAAPPQPVVEQSVRPPLRIDFWAVDDDGSLLCPLPQPLSWDLSLIPGETGAVKLEYPVDGINFAVLDERISRYRDLRVAIRTDGRHASSLGALLQAREGDEVAEGGAVTFSGKFLTQLLDEAPIPRNGADARGEWRIWDGTAGAILGQLIGIVQDQGFLDGLTWTFTDTHDSAGTLWPNQTSVLWSPGKTILEVAQQLRAWEMCEFEVTTDLEIRAYAFGSVGTDHTQADPPVVFRRGRDLTEAPRRTDVTDATTDLLVAGAGGVYIQVSDPTAVAIRGRRIGRYVSEGNLGSFDAAAAYAQVELARSTVGVDELTHSLTFDQNQPVPLRELGPLDLVFSDRGAGVEVERIAQLTVSQASGEDRYSGAIVLGDLIDATDVSLQRQLDGLTGGQIVTGTSISEPAPDDGKAPARVVGVAVTSGWYPDGDSGWAHVNATWLPVNTNDDATDAFDITRYEIAFRYTSGGELPTEWIGVPSIDANTTETDWDRVIAGQAIEVRIRAVDKFGLVGEWSDPEAHTTDSDGSPPPVPSTPVVDNYIGLLRIVWDGLGSAGEAMSDDFNVTQILASEISDFDPATDAFVMVGQLRGRQTYAWSPPGSLGDADYGTTWFVKLRSVDTSGNISATSAQGSAIPGRVQEGDVASVNVGVLTAGILSAIVANAGMIYGGDPTGPGYELDAFGLRFYDDDHNLSFEGGGPDGTVEMRGKLTTGAGPGVGRSVVVDPGSSTPAVLLYPNATLARYSLAAQSTSRPDGTTAAGLQLSSLNTSGQTDGFAIDAWSTNAWIGHKNTSGVFAGGHVALERTGLAGIYSDEAFVQVDNSTGAYMQSTVSGAQVAALRTGAARINNGSNSANITLASGGEIDTTPIGTQASGFRFRAASGDSQGYRMASDGSRLRFVQINGNDWVADPSADDGLKCFVIDHPTDPERWLVHACTEAPEAQVEYRGVAELVDGAAVVELPAYFEAATLPVDRTVHLTMLLPDEPLDREIPGPSVVPPVPPLAWDPDPPPTVVPEKFQLYPIAASVPHEGRFRIASRAPDGTQVAWLVKAVRADSARVVAEPLRSEVDVAGFGPYRTTQKRK